MCARRRGYRCGKQSHGLMLSRADKVSGPTSQRYNSKWRRLVMLQDMAELHFSVGGLSAESFLPSWWRKNRRRMTPAQKRVCVMPYGRKRWQNAGCCVRGVHQGFKNVEQGWVEVLQRPWDRQTIMTRSHGKRKLPQVIQSEGEDLEGS